jgi:hypothetical protein
MINFSGVWTYRAKIRERRGVKKIMAMKNSRNFEQPNLERLGLEPILLTDLTQDKISVPLFNDLINK